MVLCKFWPSRTCRNGANCQFIRIPRSRDFVANTKRSEHPGGTSIGNKRAGRPDGGGSAATSAAPEFPFTKDTIKATLSDLPIWKLSSYGPARGEPNLIAGADISPIELQWQYYQAKGDPSQYPEQALMQAQEARVQNVLGNLDQAYSFAAQQSKRAPAKNASQPPASSAFGAASRPSAFGAFGSQQPSSSTNTGFSSFGKPQTSSAFGSTSAPSAFGSSSGFGSTGGAFGGQSSGGFGQTSGFGAAASSTPSAFGQPSAFGSTSAFGQTQSSLPASNAFGATASQQQSSPAQSTGFSAFGATSQPSSTSGFSSFGQTSAPTTGFSAFNSNNNTANNQPSPATAAAATSATPFGSGPAPTSAFGQSGFGSGASNSFQTPAFGQTASTGTPAFGAPATGSAPSAFGQSGFGQPSSSGAFGAFGSTGNNLSAAAATPSKDPFEADAPKESDLSPEDLAAYQAPSFTWGEIPLMPPPISVR